MLVKPKLGDDVLQTDIDQTEAVNATDVKVVEHDSKIMQLLNWMGLVKDYIIERGKDGSYRWTRYKSNAMVLTIDILKPVPGNGSNNIVVDLPFEFVNEPIGTHVSCTLRTASGSVNELRVSRSWLSSGKTVTLTVINTTGQQNGVFQILVDGFLK